MSAPPKKPGGQGSNSSSNSKHNSDYDTRYNHLDPFTEAELESVEGLLRQVLHTSPSSTPSTPPHNNPATPPGQNWSASRRSRRQSNPQSSTNKGLLAIEEGLALTDPNKPSTESPTKAPNSTGSTPADHAKRKRGTARRVRSRSEEPSPRYTNKKVTFSDAVVEEENVQQPQRSVLVPDAPLLAPQSSRARKTPTKNPFVRTLFPDDSKQQRAQATKDTFGGELISLSRATSTAKPALHTQPRPSTQAVQVVPDLPERQIALPPPGTTTAFAEIFGADASAPTTPTTQTNLLLLPTITMSQSAAALGVTTPAQTRSLRACMVCSIIQTHSVFLSHGCPNCEAVLQLAGNSDNVNECTSSNYNGIIAVMQTEGSWVARYHRLDGYVQGMYAVQVVGNLSEDVIERVRAAGMRFVRRDGSKEEDVEMEDPRVQL